MGVISGILCEVNGVSSLSAWKIRDINMPAEFATSDAPGGVGNAAGNADWKGVYRAYGHTPLEFPGEAITFLGDVDASYGCSGTGIVDKMTVTWPVREGGLIEHIVEFSGNGALTYGAAGATVGATPAIVSAISRCVALDGALQTDVWGQRLVIECRNRKYASCTSAGQIQRVAGNVSGQFEYKVFEDDGGELPTRGALHVVRMYATATTYWELTWGLITAVEDWGGDHEGDDPVGAVIRGVWSAQNGTSIGTIKNPATSTLWP